MTIRCLAQIGQSVAVPELTSGPLWNRLILEQPWPTAGAVFLLAGAVALVFARAGKAKPTTAAIALGLALSTAIAAAGLLVETTRELLIRQTRAFVDAVAAGRTAEVAALVEELVALRTSGESVDGDRALIVGVTAAMPAVLRDHSVRTRGAEVTGVNVARSRMTIRASVTGAIAGEAYSSWDLSWRRDDTGAWRIAGIECLSVFGREPGREWVNVARQIARDGSGQ
jgi:hypothetical protein